MYVPVKLGLRLPVFLHQQELFCTGQLLNGVFPAKGRRFIRQAFLIDQRDRKMAAGIFGPGPGLVLPEPFFQPEPVQEPLRLQGCQRGHLSDRQPDQPAPESRWG